MPKVRTFADYDDDLHKTVKWLKNLDPPAPQVAIEVLVGALVEVDEEGSARKIAEPSVIDTDAERPVKSRSSIEDLKGIGPKRAKSLMQVGIFSIEDMSLVTDEWAIKHALTLKTSPATLKKYRSKAKIALQEIDTE